MSQSGQIDEAVDELNRGLKLAALFLGLRRRSERQADDEPRALAGRGLDLDRAPVPFHHAACQRQSKSGALAVGLGREERVEDPRSNFARNSGPLSLTSIRTR